MSRFSIRLTSDDILEARRFAKKRGDAGPKAAIAEKVVSLACRRRWEGAFQNLQKWDSWKKLGRVANTLECRLSSSLVGGLEVVEMTADDTAIVLVSDREQPTFVLVGWAFAGDVQKPKYWRESDRKFLMPHADLRSCWQLKRERRTRGRRLNPNDPADDFAGHGKWPGMLDTDDGRHPSHYGNLIRSKWALPCRRCQTLVPAGALSGGNKHTGNIHGDPADCAWKHPGDD